MNERMNEWKNEWMNERMNEWIESHHLASGSGDGVSLSVWTALGNMEGVPYQVPWEKDNNRYIKRDANVPCKWVSLYTGDTMSNLEGIHFLGLFEKKE
jgi:hypothetical protein